MLGFGEKSVELYKMINPIEHSRSKDSANKYKVEPYVIAADVYGAKNLAGRGGWTWYTGSSSWYYQAGIEYILGLKIKENILSIEPCIPKDWKEYFIRYKYKESIYNIKVTNPNRKNTGETIIAIDNEENKGIEKFILNGKEIKEKKIKLENSGEIYNIEIII